MAGELGPGTRFDRSTRPATVTRLEYRFTDWLGDALVESTPCFIVTDALAERMTREGLTGAAFDAVTVTLSPEGEELIDEPLPQWLWLKVTGSPGDSDIGVTDELMLVVSDRALSVLEESGLNNAVVV